MAYQRFAGAGADRGVSLDIVTPERFPFVSRRHPRWWVLLVPLSAALWLWRRRRQYDIAFFHSYAGWIFNLLPSGLATVTDFHGLEPLFHAAVEREHRAQGRRLSWRYRAVYGWMMPRVLRATCRRSRAVTCLNHTERRYLIDHCWAPPDRIVVLHQSVSSEFYVDRREYAPRATRLLVLSQWLETKGVAYLVAAFTALSREHPDLQLWCYGTRVNADKVLSQFPPDVRDHVKVVQDIDPADVAAVYREADLFVHPSLSEGSGSAIMQAMAAALPIVVTPVGLVPDLLEDGRDCLLVPTRDSAALAAAVSRLMGDAGLRRRLGTAARLAADVFQSETTAQQFFDFLRSVARSDARPA